MLEERTAPGSDDSTEADLDDGGGARVLCKNCRHEITTEAARYSADGKHEHTFFNPDGVVFHVRCFSAAPGGSATGDATDYFSWFKGYLWRVFICRACGEHLGWRFESTGSVFFGLISTKLLDI